MATVGSRHVLVGCAAGLVVFGLTSCDSEAFNGPLELSGNASTVQFAVCDDIVASELYASVRAPGDDWVRFWEASGQTSLSVSDIIGPNDSLDGMTVDLAEAPRLEPGAQIAITINSSDGRSLASQFEIPIDLGSDEWLSAEGESSREVCD